MSEELNSIETQAQNLISKHPKNGGEIFFLTFRQLNCLAVMVILGASGMVSLEDFGIFVFSAIYMCFLSKFAFPLNEAQQKPVFDPDSKILGFYLLFTAVIGLFLPIFYIFYGIIGGDKDEIKAAVPHVFLLTSQVNPP
ncbi:uncharacterized protein [Spinacia oleracea]|uniref:DUF7733 domain-containing protein n=1 Tax=Spinacia oleracea TaxID=3562 RepID=A0A9R0ILP3_SPIOL|nr:uncharacterized protein LOC110791110 [Spinacia oleracea]